MLSVIMLSVIMLSVIMLSVVMLSVIMVSVIMLSVIMLSVVMLSVEASFEIDGTCNKIYNTFRLNASKNVSYLTLKRRVSIIPNGTRGEGRAALNI
jgi:hypothetical protein